MSAHIELDATDPLAELRELSLELGRTARAIGAGARVMALGPTIPDPLDPDHTITGYVVDRLYRRSRRAVALQADANPDLTADAYRAGYDPQRFNPPRGADR